MAALIAKEPKEAASKSGKTLFQINVSWAVYYGFAKEHVLQVTFLKNGTKLTRRPQIKINKSLFLP